MCIYCGTNKYRNIYEHHYGPIPKEESGRSYEIHHIDGNHSNNNPANLKCVSIQEHYNIHYSQGDWAACVKMSSRINLPPDELVALATKNANKLVKTGKHPWVGPNKHQAQLNRDRILNGTHNWLDREAASKRQLNRLAAGTHHFVNDPKKKEKHPQYDHTVRTWKKSYDRGGSINDELSIKDML
jgi:hypothetical protein